MNWYREAKLIEDFSDRNLVNHSIQRLDKVSETLLYCSELVYQTGRGARGMVYQIANSKLLSTYPEIVDLLMAANKVALDSPKKFAEICKDAANQLSNQAAYLEDERNKFVSEDNPQRYKGWVDEHQ